MSPFRIMSRTWHDLNLGPSRISIKNYYQMRTYRQEYKYIHHYNKITLHKIMDSQLLLGVISVAVDKCSASTYYWVK